MLALLLTAAIAAGPIDRFMQVEYPVADGFDLPLGDGHGGGRYRAPDGRTHRGFRISTHFGEKYSLGLHPGEDYNGRGGGNSDLGQPVRSIGAGRVIFARSAQAPWGNIVMVEHTFYDNHIKRVVVSSYAHLGSILVVKGQNVGRRQQLGTIGQDPDRRYFAHLHLEIRQDLSLAATYWPSSHGQDLSWIQTHYLAPTAFIKARPKLPVPQSAPTLAVVDQGTRTLKLYKQGKLKWQAEVGFGQKPGQKRRQGDLRTPRGMYFVTNKSRGPFGGDYGAYYGGHWIKINYPNPWDADYGLAQGWLKKSQATKIKRAWTKQKLTNQRTKLGGGIGFHGWVGPWTWQDSGWLSWGCVVLHNQDIPVLYEYLKPGAMVILM